MTTRDLHATFEQLILTMHTPREGIEFAIAGQNMARSEAVIDPCSGTAAFAVAAAEQVQPPIRQEGT